MILFENPFRIFRNISYFISYLSFYFPLFLHTQKTHMKDVSRTCIDMIYFAMGFLRFMMKIRIKQESPCFNQRIKKGSLNCLLCILISFVSEENKKS